MLDVGILAEDEPVELMMPACCAVTRAARRAGDGTLDAPPSGQGASLRIRYKLPR